MKDRKYRWLLLLGFSLLIIILILTSLLGEISLNKIDELFEHTYSNSFREWIVTEKANADLIAIHRAMMEVELSSDEVQIQIALEDINKYDAQIRKKFDTLNGIDSNNDFLKEVIIAYKNWEPIRAKTIEFAHKDLLDLATKKTRTINTAQIELLHQKMQLLINHEEIEAQSSYELFQIISKRLQSILFWLALCSIVITMAISLYIGKKLALNEKELYEEKEELKIIFESIGDGIITTDLNKNIIKLNRVAEKMTGWRSEEAEGKSLTEVFDIVNSVSGEKAKNPVDDVLDINQVSELESNTVLRAKLGTERYVEFGAAPLKNRGEVITGVIMVFRDVSDKKQFQHKLEISEQHYRMLFNSMLNGYALHEMIFDENGIPCDYKFTDVNPAFEDMTGMKKTDCVGRTIKEITPETDNYWIDTYGKVTITGVSEKYENFSEGTGKYFEIYAFRPKENHFAVIVNDVTDKKLNMDRINYLSFNDSLTGLGNRVFFEAELMRINNENSLPISIVMGDINGLKLSNDVFGHEAGDTLLKSIANILKKNCDENCTIARYGGDEFVIILQNTSNDKANEICENIRLDCAKSESEKIVLSIALGSSTKYDFVSDIKITLKEAEDRMYSHKLVEGKSVRSKIITSLQNTLFEKSCETEEHAVRMMQLVAQFGTEIHLSQYEIDEIKLLALLHDLGKIGIPDNILNKPGKLTHDEWSKMKKHPEIGYRIAQATSELAHISELILTHHEHWDGNGYPQGLKGEQIPKLSRIISIIDAYDVITHERSYNEPVSVQDALEEIKKCAGTQFDPYLVKEFIKIITY